MTSSFWISRPVLAEIGDEAKAQGKTPGDFPAHDYDIGPRRLQKEFREDWAPIVVERLTPQELEDLKTF